MRIKYIIAVMLGSMLLARAGMTASLQWGTAASSYISDENGNLLTPCTYDFNNMTYASYGDKVYLYQDVNCDGPDPLTNNDDDQILDESFIGEGNFCLNEGQFSAVTDIAVGTYCLFVRAFNDPDPLNATYYGDSLVQTITVTAPDDTLSMEVESFQTLTPVPTAVFMKDLFAIYEGGKVYIYWSTGYEVTTKGFKIVRYDGKEEQEITSSLIPAKLNPFGWNYSYVDENVEEGKNYIYYVVEVEFSGKETRYGPVSVSTPSSSGIEVKSEDGIYRVSVKVPKITVNEKNQKVLLSSNWDNLPVGGYLLPLKTLHFGIPDGNYTLKLTKYIYRDIAVRNDLRKITCPPLPEIPGIHGLTTTECKTPSLPKGNDGFAPPQPVEVVGDYILRNQRVIKVNIYPVRIDGNILRIAENIEFEVIPEQPIKNHQNDPLEKVYKFLKNYASAKEYRIPLKTKAKLSAELPSRYLKVSCEGKGAFEIPFSEAKDILGSDELMLSYEGKPLRYYTDGENIIFYIPGYKSYYTEKDSVFIYPGPPSLAEQASSLDSGNPLSSFTENLHFSTDNYLFPAIPVGDNGELWFMKILNQGTNSIPVAIPYPASSSGTVSLKLFSYVGSTDPLAYHHVKIYLNGTFICEDIWRGRTWREVTCNVENIQSGDNTLEVEVLNDGGINGDMILLDEFTVNYKRHFKTDGEQLSFEISTEGNVSICCFSSEPIIAKIDTTGIEKIIDGNISQNNNSFLIDAILPPGSYLAGVPSENCSLTAREPSIISESEGYNMVIISDNRFKDVLQRLIKRRTLEGLSVTFVDVEDLYDEYTYGRKDPEAIKLFINDVYTRWSGKLSYILIVGDASYDPRNIIFNNNDDIIPVKFLETEYLSYHSPSDTYLTAVSGEDIVPDVAIGRIPAKKPEELNRVLDKIERFEEKIDKGEAPLSALFVADDDSLGRFEESMRRLRESYPDEYELHSFNWRDFNGDSEGILSQIKSEANRGITFFNYSGHGSVDSWSKHVFINTDDFSSFSNTFPFILLPQTCLNGYFVVPVLKSLGEGAVLSQDAAVSAWVSSGFTYPGPQLSLMQAFARAVFEEKVSRIGDALLYALASVEGADGWEDVVKTWIFMGDPSMRLAPVQVSSTVSQPPPSQTRGGNGGTEPISIADKGVFSCSEGKPDFSFVIFLAFLLLFRLRKVKIASL